VLSKYVGAKMAQTLLDFGQYAYAEKEQQ